MTHQEHTVTTETIPLEHFTAWLASGERGVSSEAIVAKLTGARVGRYGDRLAVPYDPSDFRRCERLLRDHPLGRLYFAEMRTVSPTWAALVDAWPELLALAESEVPGIFDGARPDGSAPKTYARMQEIRDAARLGLSPTTPNQEQ